MTFDDEEEESVTSRGLFGIVAADRSPFSLPADSPALLLLPKEDGEEEEDKDAARFEFALILSLAKTSKIICMRIFSV